MIKADVRNIVKNMFKGVKMDEFAKQEANYTFSELCDGFLAKGEITTAQHTTWMKNKMYVIKVIYQKW